MSYRTLEDALSLGHGIERSFICPVHNDHNASASVNSLTGLYTCYACGWSGKVDPKTIELTSEGVARHVHQVTEELAPVERYSESWLNTFDATGPGEYWLTRFSRSTCEHFRLGHAEGIATYPMRDNGGRVLGVVSRDLTGVRNQKYRYPSRVKVSRYLMNFHRVESETVLLVEGMTDVAAAFEAGYELALGCYRAGLSKAQAALLRRYDPKRVLVGFDMDPAGDHAFQDVVKAVDWGIPVHRLWWSDYKDLAEIPLDDRRRMLAEVI